MSFIAAEQRALLRRTRVWSEGLVVEAGLEDGVIWVEVELVPDEHQVVCEFAPLCPGFFRLPREGEEVLCGFVDADRTQGYVVGHTGPQLPDGAEGETLYVWAPDGERVVIQATGSGQIELHAPIVRAKADKVVVDSNDIRLGGEAAGDKVVTQSRLNTRFALFKAHYGAHQHTFVGPLIPGPPQVTTPGAPPQTGAPDLKNSSSDDVKAT